jgi:hypothetical protein
MTAAASTLHSLAAAAERKAQKDTEDAARNARIALKRQGTKSLITADLD